jgi:MFS family permease
MSLAVAGPGFKVFMVKELELSAATIGVLTALTSLTALVGQRWWGMQYNKLGDMGIFRITGLLIPIWPFIWLVTTSAWHVAFINFAAGLTWSGYNLAVFNLLLSLTPDRGRERYVAVYQTAVFLSACIAPLLGAWLADTIGFRALFGLSGFGRLAATVLFFGLIAQRSGYRERRQHAAHPGD